MYSLMNKSFIFFVIIFFCSCFKEKFKNKVKGEIIPLKYSKNLLISNDDSFFYIYSIDNKDTQLLLNQNKKKGIDKIIVLSSVFFGGFKLLEEQNRIIAVDNYNYYYDSSFIENFKDNKIESIGDEGQLNLEKIIQLKPDLIISNTQKSIQDYSRLQGIKIIPCVSYKENHPLARAEWIKFFGILSGQFKKSELFFNQIEKNYIENKDSATKISNTFFCELLYGNTWNIPGGDSYMANLIKDAGGKYQYENKKESYTYQMSFEQVYTDCRESDIWLNPGLISTKEELKVLDKRFFHFKAFKNGNIYNNNRKTRKNGANDYWETGPYRPDLILKDLILINELKEENNRLLQYFKKVD